MCGIAGLIHKGKSSNVGGEMTAMLQALKHRGRIRTGYAVYGGMARRANTSCASRSPSRKTAPSAMGPQADQDRIAGSTILAEHGARDRLKEELPQDMRLRYVLTHDGDTPAMAEHIEEDRRAPRSCRWATGWN